eukprot:GILK01004482.1.p1 GENE.GILK01004482.1~~GILK01004482.1.p1  ORF type:complete len:496 (-),score=101.69 GILK01004482.1:1313-2800(-)
MATVESLPTRQKMPTPSPAPAINEDDLERLSAKVSELFEKNKTEEALNLAFQFSMLAFQTSGQKSVAYAGSLSTVAAIMDALGGKKEAEKLLLQSAEVYHECMSPNDPNYLQSCQELSELYEKADKQDKVDEIFEKVKTHLLGKTQANPSPEGNLNYAIFLSNSAQSYAEKSRDNISKKLFKELAIFLQSHQVLQSEQFGRMLSQLGKFYEKKGDLEKAAGFYQEAIGIFEDAAKLEEEDEEETPSDASDEDDESSSDEQAANGTQEDETIRRLLMAYKNKQDKKLKNEHSAAEAGDILNASENKVTDSTVQKPARESKEDRELSADAMKVRQCMRRAERAVVFGEIEEAEEKYEEVLCLLEEMDPLEKDNNDFLRCLLGLAQVYETNGDGERAELLLQDAADLAAQTWGELSGQHANAMNRLAQLYDKFGDFESAEHYYSSAHRIWSHLAEDMTAEEESQYRDSLTSLAGIYVATGQDSRAEKLYVLAYGLMRT